jgi:hypothetical protein
LDDGKAIGDDEGLATRKRFDAVIDLRRMHVRFVMACAAFVLSLLVVVPASHHLLWVCTIVATEWGCWLALALLGLLVAELYVGRGIFRMATFTLCVAAIALYSLPFVEGFFVAAHLPAGLSEAFGLTRHHRHLVRLSNLASCGGPEDHSGKNRDFHLPRRRWNSAG